jgi:hypothetical protein
MSDGASPAREFFNPAVQEPLPNVGLTLAHLSPATSPPVAAHQLRPRGTRREAIPGEAGDRGLSSPSREKNSSR